MTKKQIQKLLKDRLEELRSGPGEGNPVEPLSPEEAEELEGGRLSEATDINIGCPAGTPGMNQNCLPSPS